MSSLSSLTSASPGTASQPPISFNGLISGLDTSSVITGLLANEQAQNQRDDHQGNDRQVGSGRL